MGFFGGQKFDKNRLKSHLKMSTGRINLLRNKKVNMNKLQKREVAQLLLQEKDESARIKVENIIREDYALEAFDILSLYCDLILSRVGLVAESKVCPTDLKEAISTIIYAAPRVEIPEFDVIRQMLAKKFGKEFVEAAVENKDLAVNQRVIFKLGVKVPDPYMCVQYLKEIARENNIEWDDTAVSQPPTQNDVLPPQMQNQPQTFQPQNNDPLFMQQQQQMMNNMGGNQPFVTQTTVTEEIVGDSNQFSNNNNNQNSFGMQNDFSKTDMFSQNNFNQGSNSNDLQFPQDLFNDAHNESSNVGYNTNGFNPPPTQLNQEDASKLQFETTNEEPSYDFDELQKRFAALKKNE